MQWCTYIAKKILRYSRIVRDIFFLYGALSGLNQGNVGGHTYGQHYNGKILHTSAFLTTFWKRNTCNKDDLNACQGENTEGKLTIRNTATQTIAHCSNWGIWCNSSVTEWHQQRCNLQRGAAWAVICFTYFQRYKNVVSPQETVCIETLLLIYYPFTAVT